MNLTIYLLKKLNTYKHLWLESKITGNCKRVRKDKYALEFIGKLMEKVSYVFKSKKTKNVV